MKYVLLFLAFFASNVFAIGLGNDNPPSLGGNSTNTNLNANSISSRIDNDVRASALSYAASQANSVNQGGLAQAVSGGGSGGSVALNVPAGVAAVGLGGLYPSAPCMGTSNIGGGNPFFNIAVGTSWESKECQIRETARSFSAVGLTNDAIAILCSSEYAAVAPSCAKTKE